MRDFYSEVRITIINNKKYNKEYLKDVRHSSPNHRAYIFKYSHKLPYAPRILTYARFKGISNWSNLKPPIRQSFRFNLSVSDMI